MVTTNISISVMVLDPLFVVGCFVWSLSLPVYGGAVALATGVPTRRRMELLEF